MVLLNAAGMKHERDVKDGMEAAVSPGKCDCLSFNYPRKVSGNYFTFEELRARLQSRNMLKIRTSGLQSRALWKNSKSTGIQLHWGFVFFLFYTQSPVVQLLSVLTINFCVCSVA